MYVANTIGNYYVLYSAYVPVYPNQGEWSFGELQIYPFSKKFCYAVDHTVLFTGLGLLPSIRP